MCLGIGPHLRTLTANVSYQERLHCEIQDILKNFHDWHLKKLLTRQLELEHIVALLPSC